MTRQQDVSLSETVEPSIRMNHKQSGEPLRNRKSVSTPLSITRHEQSDSKSDDVIGPSRVSSERVTHAAITHWLAAILFLSSSHSLPFFHSGLCESSALMTLKKS